MATYPLDCTPDQKQAEQSGGGRTWNQTPPRKEERMNDNPNGSEMIKRFLEEHGFDGLYTDECGCQLSDLMPCSGEWAIECKAGYKSVGDFEFDGEKYKWCIGKEKL